MAYRQNIHKILTKFLAVFIPVLIAFALFLFFRNFQSIIIAFIAISFVILLYLLYVWVRVAYEKKEIIDGFVESMYMILFYRSSKKPLAAIIESLSPQIKHHKLDAALKEVSARIKLGEQFGSALPKSLHAHGIDISISDYESNNWYLQISNFIESYNNKQRSSISSLESSIQRNSTINMFISSVAPSFIIFMFIGNLIIYGNYNITVIIVLLLFVLPFAYALGTAISTRRLLEVPI